MELRQGVNPCLRELPYPFLMSRLSKRSNDVIVKLPAHRAGLPGNEISFLIVPLDPAYKAGLAGHLQVNRKGMRDETQGSAIRWNRGLARSLRTRS